MKLTSARFPVFAQSMAVALALVVLTVWPPSSGKMLLVPLTGIDTNGVAKLALAGGAALLGTGPFPGSVVIVGDRSEIARQIMGLDILILAAPPAGCGPLSATSRLT